jgi:hypothetical protein
MMQIDPLESELRSFRPTDLSPEVYARVASKLLPSRSHGRLWMAAAAAAACLFAAVGLWHTRHPGDGPAPRQLASLATAPVAATNRADADEPPSLANYRRALSASPAALDDLLDRHAARLLPFGGRQGNARVTASSDLDILH